MAIDRSPMSDTLPLPASGSWRASGSRVDTAIDDGRGQHVERVARTIARRLAHADDAPFTLAHAERVNVTTGWKYRYVTSSGSVIRAEGVSLPSDALIDAWKLAKALAPSSA